MNHLGNSKYYLRLIWSTRGPKWVRSMSYARHLRCMFFYQYFLVRSSITLRARSTILAIVSPFACGSRVISRDSPQRENLLEGYLRTFIRSLLKLRIVKERAPENEPRIQLGVNSLKVDTYQTWLYIIGVSLQICLLIGPASAPYSPPPPAPYISPFIFSFIASETKICFRYLNHSQ